MKVSLKQAASLLNSGKVVAVPTETVYGLAASLKHEEAVKEIFRLKGRPSNNPLIVHVASVAEIQSYVTTLPPHFSSLAEAFWPGPLTLVIPVIESVLPSIARAGLSTAAFRIPGHALALELLKATGPLVMPSANLSGKPSATSVGHVEQDFGVDFPVLDGDQCAKGVESTILYLERGKWIVIRLGALAPKDFLPVLDYIPEVGSAERENSEKPICPGQLYRHYSPKAKLVLLKHIPENLCGVLIGFSDKTYPQGCRVFTLGSSSNPDAAARELYALLRKLDSEHIHEAFVDMNFSNEGLWLTLRERLQKAASST